MPAAAEAPSGLEPPATVAEWHALEPDAVLAALGARAEGLTGAEAAERLRRCGPNALAERRGAGIAALIAAQLRNVLVLVLLVALGLSAVLGHAVEAITIGVIVVLAVALGFAQEYRAERALESLRRLSAPTATALRDGAERRIPAAEVVPGDVLVVRAGDRIAADARLLTAVNLRADEALLTGESVAVDKAVAPLAPGPRALGDRSDMVFAGTAATYGRGRAVVVATGAATELGRIAGLLERVQAVRTPLQADLDRVGVVLARAAAVIVVAVVALGVLRGESWTELLVFGLALAVAVVPEALPAVVTISLALGAQRLARRNALVRKLAAVETLGSTSVICSDKTGTLTCGQMTVRAVWAGGRLLEVTGAGLGRGGGLALDGAPVAPTPAARALLETAVLASDARLTAEDAGAWASTGDPTEAALAVAAEKAGIRTDRLDVRFPRRGELPFTSERKRMATLVADDGALRACVKGAPEVILPACDRVFQDGGEAPLDAGLRAALGERIAALAASGHRVLAVARRGGATLATAEAELVLLGLVGMIDPPRPEAAAAVARCREAGVKAVMITGDHPLTAAAIARELGILRAGRVLTGPELEALDDGALRRAAPEVEVYARVSPADKLRVVTALQAHGHVVAMTGDGVNDAPALKRADVGVAMGRSGTDVARDAAAVTLADDDFSTIVAAVEEGRRIFANVKKYLTYLLASNAGEIGIMVGASVLALPLPLTAVQILYVNLATDGLPALALSVDPAGADLMRRPPRDPRRGLFTRPVVALMVAGACWSTLANLGVFAWALRAGLALDEARTLCFVTLVATEFVKAFAFRSERASTLRRPFANRWLDAAVGWELLLLSAVVYLPFLQRAFGTFALPGGELALAAGVALSMLVPLELVKAVIRRAPR